MKEYGIAVLGAGMIAAAHAAGYHTYRHRFEEQGAKFALRTVCDIESSAAGTLARRYGVERTADDWRAVMDDPRVDIVSVALPNYEHGKATAAALDAGKHVLCEKPLALSAAEARDIVEKGNRATVVAGSVFNYRRIPAVAEIQRRVVAGDIGDLIHMTAEYHSDYAADPLVPYSWRYERARSGGGALHDLGAHPIDTVRFIAGEVTEVLSAASTITVPERYLPAGATRGHDLGALSNEKRIVDNDDMTTAMLRVENGATVHFTASRVTVGMGNTMHLCAVGTKGTITFTTARPGEYTIAQVGKTSPYPFRTVLNHPAFPHVSEYAPVPHDRVAIGWAESFGYMIAEFMEAIATGGVFTGGSLIDGLRVAEILEAIQRAADGGGSVRTV